MTEITKRQTNVRVHAGACSLGPGARRHWVCDVHIQTYVQIYIHIYVKV